MEEHDSLALDFIRATRWIRENLPGAHVSGGVSNLSFSFRGNNYLREAMHAVFLHHAQLAGMDFGIVNPVTKVTYDNLPQSHLQVLEDAILYRRKDAAERLMELASEVQAQALPSSASGVDTGQTLTLLSVDDRLQQALIHGNGAHLADDLHEALSKYTSALDIITGPLMDGMREVGRRFAEGHMFLPQVVKTARTMKQAVDILTREGAFAGKSEGSGNTGKSGKPGKILLATVKGDVHDIGKNIVSVIMACNGYEVIDMGVMVPADEIVKKACEEHVDMIGLSGLITPSLEEMVNVAKALRQADLDIPIMIGGATTSQLHVALKIAPVYGGPVVWMKDASQNPIVARQLMADADRLSAELNQQYAELRQQYHNEQQQLLSLDEARSRRLTLFDN